MDLRKDIIDEIAAIDSMVASELANPNVESAKNLERLSFYLQWVKDKYEYIVNCSGKRSVKKGEIYYCDFGCNIGSEQNGLRPAIILQNDTGNVYSPTTVVAPITNAPKKKLPIQIELTKLSDSLQTTGVIRLEQMRSISKCRLGVFIERIDTKSKAWNLVENAIKIELDIT